MAGGLRGREKEGSWWMDVEALWELDALSFILFTCLIFLGRDWFFWYIDCIKMSQQLWHSLLPLNYKLRTMIRRVIAPLQTLAGHVAAANNKVQTNLLFFTRSLTKIEFHLQIRDMLLGIIFLFTQNSAGLDYKVCGCCWSKQIEKRRVCQPKQAAAAAALWNVTEGPLWALCAGCTHLCGCCVCCTWWDVYLFVCLSTGPHVEPLERLGAYQRGHMRNTVKVLLKAPSRGNIDICLHRKIYSPNSWKT